MTDVFSKEKRSEVMSGIKGKNTKIENIVRSWLFSNGFRYRKNDSKLPGKPDIVLPKYKTVIFIHGCFWHRHEGCNYAYTPKTRVAFWTTKLNNNAIRDRNVLNKLRELGWNIIVVWECELKKSSEKRLQQLIEEIQRNL